MRERDHLPIGWRLTPNLAKDKNIRLWANLDRMAASSPPPLDNPSAATKLKRKARITLAKVKF